MENPSPFSVTHSYQFFHQSSGGAFHAPGSSTSISCPNHRLSGQHPHFIIGGGGHEDNNYNNLPDEPPSSTTFQPGQHVDPFGITSNQIYEEDSCLFDQVSNPIYEDSYLVSNPIYEDSCLFDQPVDQEWLSSSNIDVDFSLENYMHFDPTPQTQDINPSQALLHGGGTVASQSDPDAKQRRPYKRWTHEEMSKLLVAIFESRQSRNLWVDVKNNHFSADNERSENTLKQKFKDMGNAASSSGVRDPKTKELYDLALWLRGEIQQERASRNHSRGN